MSHNTYTVGLHTPNRESSITASFDTFEEILIGQRDEQAYTSSGATSLIGSALYFYDLSPINTITGATISASSGWVDSVTLPSGRYVLTAGFNVVFSSSGQFSYQWHDGSSGIGNKAQIGDVSQFPLESAKGVATLMTVVTTSKTYSVRSISGATGLDTLNAQGVVPSRYGFMRVRRL